MSFNFVADSMLLDKAYPALATWQATPYTPEWQEFVSHWPYTIPCELHEHCKKYDFPYKIHSIENYPDGSYYTIGLGFFDFTVDYFGLLPKVVSNELLKKRLKVLFYYHVGDNPYYIKERLDNLCLNYQLPLDCYRVVSGNTAAKNISKFVYFPDHELLYHRRNQLDPLPIHMQPREKDFTILSRTHKWWRATIMHDLYQKKLLTNSYWSYNTQISTAEKFTNNPLKTTTPSGAANWSPNTSSKEIYDNIIDFLSAGPYRCDTMTDSDHNNHSIIEPMHHTNSYCNIVLETHIDADQSDGTFLTEKTFKPIKHGQPFIIVGPPGSLQTLRELGYQTFDSFIDNSYDLELDNTKRWAKILNSIQQLKKQDLHKWFLNCISEVKHNQQLFVTSKYSRLNNLYDKLLH